MLPQTFWHLAHFLGSHIFETLLLSPYTSNRVTNPLSPFFCTYCILFQILKKLWDCFFKLLRLFLLKCKKERTELDFL